MVEGVEVCGVTIKRHLKPTSISATAYFIVAAGIYSSILGFVDAGLIALTGSLENVLRLLVATGLGFETIAEGALLVIYRKQFRATAPSEIRKSDLVKILVSFAMTLFFSYVSYLFAISRQPNLRDPLAFLVVSVMVYFAIAAFCRNIRYIPLFFIFLRGEHERT